MNPISPMSTRNSLRYDLPPVNSVIAAEILSSVTTLSLPGGPVISRENALPKNSCHARVQPFCNLSECVLVSRHDAVSRKALSSSALFLVHTGRHGNHRLLITRGGPHSPYLRMVTSPTARSRDTDKRGLVSRDPKSGGVHRFYLRF